MAGLHDLINAATAAAAPELPTVMVASVLDSSPLRVICPAIDGGKHAINAVGPTGLSEGDVVRVIFDETGDLVVISPSGSGGGGEGYNPPIPQSDVDGLTAALAGKAAASHTHSQSDVTDLTLDLASKITRPSGATNGYVLGTDGTDELWVPPSNPNLLIALTDSPTITIDASLGNSFDVTLGGNRSMGQPLNPTDGQTIKLRVNQDNTGGRTLNFSSTYWAFAGVASSISTARNQTTYFEFRYNAASSRWECVLNRRGYGGTGLMAEILADLPVAYWPMDESSGSILNDATGNGRNLTLVGSPTLGAAGLTGTAVEFNGSSQRAEFASALTGWGMNSDVWSLEVICKADSTSLFPIANSETNLPSIALNGTTLQAITWQGGSTRIGDGTTSKWLDFGFHHLVFTKSGSTRKCYVDGVDVTQSGLTDTAITWGGTKLFVGYAPNPTWADGKMQHLALYNTALTPARVATHYNAI